MHITYLHQTLCFQYQISPQDGEETYYDKRMSHSEQRWVLWNLNLLVNLSLPQVSQRLGPTFPVSSMLPVTAWPTPAATPPGLTSITTHLWPWETRRQGRPDSSRPIRWVFLLRLFTLSPRTRGVLWPAGQVESRHQPGGGDGDESNWSC